LGGNEREEVRGVALKGAKGMKKKGKRRKFFMAIPMGHQRGGRAQGE